MRKVQVKDTIDIINGFAFDSKLFNEREIGLPITRIRDVTRGFSETYFSGEYSRDYIIDNGAILIGMDGEFNIAIWKGGEALLNQRVCRVIPKPGVVDETYIRYHLSILLKAIEDNTPFVTVKHLSSNELKKKEIIIHPLPEQQRIAGILDKANRLHHQRRYALELSDTYKQSVFLEMFGNPITNPMGWNKAKLGDVILSAKDGPHVSPEYTESGIPFLSTRNIRRVE